MPRLSQKKQVELQQQQRELRIQAALHWTEQAEGPDVMPPDRFNELSMGYVYNTHYLRIDEACTSRSSHAIGRTDRTTSQGTRALYSTRERALRALRNAVERECAEKLERIDRLIEEAAATPGH